MILTVVLPRVLPLYYWTAMVEKTDIRVFVACGDLAIFCYETTTPHPPVFRSSSAIC